MEEQTECPLCALLAKTEQRQIAHSLGGSVMEPAERIRVNEYGFCQRHHGQLFLQKNRLGHALLTDSHTKELCRKLDKLAASVSGFAADTVPDSASGSASDSSSDSTSGTASSTASGSSTGSSSDVASASATDFELKVVSDSASGFTPDSASDLASRLMPISASDSLSALAPDSASDPVSGWARFRFGRGKVNTIEKLAQELDYLCEPCLICKSVEVHMRRYFYTFLQLWKKERKFKRVWSSSKGVCIPHAAELLRHAQKHLPPASQKEFAAELMALLKSALAEDEKDLWWFTQKFDYQNQDKPWGNSKNALERVVGRLRGRCLGNGE